MRQRLTAFVAILVTGTAVAVVPSVASAGTDNGNNGIVKIDGVDADSLKDNDPHVGCTFAVDWANFGKGDLWSHVTFAMKEPTGDVALQVTGPVDVFVGGDEPGGGNDLDGSQTYTLAFVGDPHREQGYHLELTIDTPDSKGSTGKKKVFWVKGCEAPTPPPTPPVPPQKASMTLTKTVADSDDADALAAEGETLTYSFRVANTGDAVLSPVVVRDAMIPALAAGATCVDSLAPGETTTCPLLPSATHVVTAAEVDRGSVRNSAEAEGWAGPGVTATAGGDVSIGTTRPAPPSTGPFSWDWRYPDPTCSALTVAYPSNIPDGQANDVNVRVRTDRGEVTLNFHNNDGFWSGTTGFPYAAHPRWPADATSWTVVWTQVGGTNYHWQGEVPCRVDPDGDGSTVDVPRAVTSIDGWRTSAVTVRKGDPVTSDAVTVAQLGDQDLVLQRASGATWSAVRAVPVSGDRARVTFPRHRHKGLFRYRLVVPASSDVTGTTTSSFTVRVR